MIPIITALDALRGFFGNRLVQGIALAGAVALGVHLWDKHEYDLGLAKGRADCVAAQKAQADQAVIDQADAAARIRAEDGAQAARDIAAAARREQAGAKAVAVAQSLPRQSCLTKEVTDALRAIPAPADQ